MQRKLKAIAEFFNVSSWGKMLFLSIAIGLIAGSAALCFQTCFHFAHEWVIGKVLSTDENWLYYILILATPSIGGLTTGLLLWRLAPEAEGHGTDSMIRAFHRMKGKIRARIPLVKMLGSLLTLGSGGSAGKEGPIAQISAGLGSNLADILRLDARNRCILMLAGASAGVGAIFRAPLGGALFASEVLYRDAEFEYEALVPSIIASITAYAVFVSVYGYGFLYHGSESLDFQHIPELILYVILGLLCTFFGYIYVRIFYFSRDKCFRRLPIPMYLRPAVGGLLLGVLAMVFPQVLSDGYTMIQQTITGDTNIAMYDENSTRASPLILAQFLFLLAFAKILATSFTIASGGSGGVFAPSLFIGAMIGGGFGYLIEGLFPSILSENTQTHHWFW